MTTLFAEGTNVTLSAPITIPINPPPGITVWVNLSNNTISGGTGSNVVTIQANGTPPPFTVQYATAQSYAMPRNTTWVQISGSGCNVTYTVTDASEDIESVTPVNMTAVITGTADVNITDSTVTLDVNATQVDVTSNGGESTAQEATDVPIPTVGAQIATFSNTSGSGVVWHVREIYFTISTVGAGSVNLSWRKTMSGGEAVPFANKTALSIAASTIAYYGISSEAPAALDGVTTIDGVYMWVIPNELVVWPGQSISVWGYASVANMAMLVLFDVAEEPL